MHDTLKNVFGFSEFRPGQEQVITQLVEGKSSVAVFPTGAGKSLCYQLPALLLKGTTLVVSPLIALMKDQIDALTLKGVSAARLDSTLTLDEYRDVAQRLRAGELKLLYVAPERFMNERFREMLSTIDVSLFAVDEAHCISEWGHNFRPDYLKLARFAKSCQADSILALTATATPSVMDDMCTFFEIEKQYAVRTPFYRSNLTLHSRQLKVNERDSVLIQQISDQPKGPTIVYVTLQKTAQRVADLLCNAGFSARPYHAGLDADVRANSQDWFMASTDSIVVATIAFGMGIDKSNIRYVYHYNIPKSLENYSQEIGRAGRDGERSICESLYCPDDLNTLENFIYGDTPERESVSGLVNDMIVTDPETHAARTQGEDIAVSLYSLSAQHDIRPLVLRTLMTYFEMDGYIEETTPIYSNYQFKPLMSSAKILENFEGEGREFLLNVFKQSKKAKTWFSIDLDRTAKNLSCDRQRLVRALDYLAEQQMLELKPSGLIHRFRITKLPESPADVIDALCEKMQHRERRDLERLGEVVDLMIEPGCQVSRLGAYFGEPLEKGCGHCSRCESQSAPAEVPRTSATIDDNLWRQATAVRSTNTALSSPVLFARFVCGISSPKLTKARLGRHELNGVFENVPFQTILDRIRQETGQDVDLPF